MTDRWKHFLRPFMPTISNYRREDILSSTDFFTMSFHHGILIMAIGFVFIFSFFLQLASMEVTTTSSASVSNVKPEQLLLSIILSIVAGSLVKSLKSIESISSQMGSQRFDKLQSQPLRAIAMGVFYLAIVAISVGFVLVISGILAGPSNSLLDLWTEAQIFEFSFMLFLYVVLAGAIGTIMSSMMLFRYEIILFTIGLRTWIRRLGFYVGIKLRPATPCLEEALEGRCPQCCNQNYKRVYSENGGDQFICSLCGLSDKVDSFTELAEISSTTPNKSPSRESPTD